MSVEWRGHRLPPGRVRVHLIDLSVHAVSDAALCPCERSRAAAFLNPGARVRFVRGRTGLRRLLGGYLGLEPAEVPIRLGAGGKPRLGPPYANLNFNLSHAGGLGLFAFVRGHEVGIDLEKVQEFPGLDEVSARFFSPAEHAALMEMTTPGTVTTHVASPDFNAAFYRTWARREAVIKALGLGLSVAPGEIGVSVGAMCGSWPLKIGGAGQPSWLTSDLELLPGFAAALAVPGGAGLGIDAVSTVTFP